MSIEDAMKTAIEFEVRIRDIYLEASAAVDEAVGRRIFETLSADEQHHIDYLQHKLHLIEASFHFPNLICVRPRQ